MKYVYMKQGDVFLHTNDDLNISTLWIVCYNCTILKCHSGEWIKSGNHGWQMKQPFLDRETFKYLFNVMDIKPRKKK